jgi:hypothetical protein
MLVVEAIPLNGEVPVQADPNKVPDQPSSFNKWSNTTDYYISGEVQVMIEVVAKS